MPQLEPVLLDTNVLLYAIDGQSAFHASARAIVDQAQETTADLCVAPQYLTEFYSLITNPKRVAVARSSVEALVAIEALISMPGMRVLPTPPDVVGRWLDLCRQYPVQGAKIFDLQLVAVMQANSVSTICTLNQKDFERIHGIQVRSL